MGFRVLLHAAGVVAVSATALIVLRRRACRIRSSALTAPAHGPLVIVIGLGGVGSHAAQLLLRGGVRRLRLIDFDQVRCSPQHVCIG